MAPENGAFPVMLKDVAPSLPQTKNPLYFTTSFNKSCANDFLPILDKPFVNATSNEPFDGALSTAEHSADASFARTRNLLWHKKFC